MGNEQSVVERQIALGLWAGGLIGEGPLRRLLGLNDALSELLTRGQNNQPYLRALSSLNARSRSSFEAVAREGRAHWERLGVETLKKLEGLGARTFVIGDEDYPRRLRSENKNAPPVLTMRGRLSLLQRPLLAVVGTRRSSRPGEQRCRLFVTDLARAGVGVVSGGALGIDTVAHRAALDQGAPTVIVCGTGLDQTYPPQNRGLFEEVGERGVIVSQFPPGARAWPRSFPRRNATIAGLAQATLVVEAPLRSGALYTAQAAQRLGRPVFVAAAPAREASFAGGYQLLEAGSGVLIHDISSIRRALDFTGSTPSIGALGLIDPARPEVEEQLPVARAPVSRRWTPLEAAIIKQLRGGGASRDELMLSLGEDRALSATLLSLELDGVVERGAGGQFRLDPHDLHGRG